MSEELKYVFTNINEWLKFAEAKIAGLLVLNGAAIIGTMQSHSLFSGKIEGFDGFIILLFCLSSCVTLYSILPVLNKWFRFYKKMNDTEFQANKPKLNHLFFGDITKLSNEQYSELFKLKNSVSVLTPADQDLIHQITNNSEIAWQKFSCFAKAGWLSFSGFGIGIVLLIIQMLK